MRWLKIEAVAALAASAVPAFCWSVPVARDLRGICPRGDDDLKELGAKLSRTGKIYFPGSTEFEQASTRWSVLETPTVNVVVVPGTENDVVETVGCPCLYHLSSPPPPPFDNGHGWLTRG